MKIMATAFLLLLGLTAAVYAQETGVIAEVFRIVNIRSGPSTTNAVIGQLTPGERVEVLARSNVDADWLLIENNGVRGWVAYFVVSVVGDTMRLPILQADTLLAPEATTAPELAAVEAVELNVERVTATTFRRANIRTLPNLTAPILTVMQRGEVLAVRARSDSSNEWLLVETPSGDGWIAYFLVTVDGDLATLPVLDRGESSEGIPATVQMPEAALQVRFNANLRLGPNIGSDILIVIPFNTVVIANGRSEDGEWIRVTYRDVQGWVLISLFAANEDIQQLSVIQ